MKLVITSAVHVIKHHSSLETVYSLQSINFITITARQLRGTIEVREYVCVDILDAIKRRKFLRLLLRRACDESHANVMATDARTRIFSLGSSGTLPNSIAQGLKMPWPHQTVILRYRKFKFVNIFGHISSYGPFGKVE